MNARKLICTMLALLLVLPMLLGAAQAEEEREGETVQIRFLAMSDLHGKFLPYDYALNEESLSGSCAQIATAVDALRDENTIIVNCGDLIQANLSELFLRDEYNPMMLSMNEIGVDVWTLGNHEFNNGMEVLNNFIAQSTAKLLCGNVYDPDGDPIADGYTILERGGVKIGMIGMTTPNIVRWDAVNLEGYTVTDPVEETKKIIAEIEDEVDVLVAMEHMMIDNEYEVPNSGVADLANACPELDLIIAAHGHNPIDDLVINGVPIIENAGNCDSLGEVLMELVKTDDGWELADVETKLWDMSEFEPKAELVEKLQPYHERALAYTNSVIGTLDADWLVEPQAEGEIPTAIRQDTALMDLINAVQTYYSGADVSVAELYQADSNLYRGDIRRSDVSLIYRYVNTLCKVQINGAQLKKWMEWSAGYFNTYTGADEGLTVDTSVRMYKFIMVSGVNYEIDVSEEVGSRIKNLTWPDGTPVRDDDVFTLATTTYKANTCLLASGSVFEEGEELPTMIDPEIGSVREMIADYIQNVKDGTITADCDNNWRLIGMD